MVHLVHLHLLNVKAEQVEIQLPVSRGVPVEYTETYTVFASLFDDDRARVDIARAQLELLDPVRVGGAEA